MAEADDMVFSPSFGKIAAPTAKQMAQEDRRLFKATDKRSLVSKLEVLKARRELERQRAQRKRQRRVRQFRAGAVAAGRGNLKSAVTTGVGAAAAVLVVGSLVALRLASGRSFENMGAKVNQILLGDIDDKARAKIATRRQLASDSDLARIIGTQGAVNSQIASVAQDLNRLNYERERAVSAFREDPRFQDNGIFDQMIERAKSLILSAFGEKGQTSLAKLEFNYAFYTAPRGSK